MSASAQTPGTPTDSGRHAGGPPKLDNRSRREVMRTGAIVVLAILITLFAVFNLNEVKVSYVFGSGKAPLIVVIVISALFGIVLTYLAERLQQRKKHR
jgi:uncharacterized integral membrane protein